jgi:hypothetical protein
MKMWPIVSIHKKSCVVICFGWIENTDDTQLTTFLMHLSFQNALVAAEDGIFPVLGHVVVVRGKAPTFANGLVEKPQVRYWSLCKLSIPSTKTVACLQDEEVALDDQGRYVIVVANERPRGTGFDYLNFGPGPLGSLAFRHMLPSNEFFPKSVMNVQNGDDEATIRRKMGEYFPEAVYCKKSTIERQGVEACF